MLLIDHDAAERDIDALLAADPHNDTDAIGHHAAALAAAKAARADLLGAEGYVTNALDNAWGEVEVSMTDCDPVYVHISNVEVIP